MKRYIKSVLLFTLCFKFQSFIAQTYNFTNPGTTNWTVPSGVNYISVYCWGAGGGGGGASYGAQSSSTWSFTGVGKGGGSGGFNKIINYPVVPGQILSVLVGAGGQYNPNGINQSGNGGTSGVTISGSANYIVAATGGTGASGAALATNPTNGIGGSPNGVSGNLQNGGGSSVCNATLPYSCPSGGAGGLGSTIPSTIGVSHGGNGANRGGGGGGGAVKDDYNGTMLIAHGGNGGNGMVVIFVSNIVPSSTSLTWGCITQGSICPNKVFVIDSYLLNSPIVITPPPGYIVSTTANFATFGTNANPLNLPINNQVQQTNTIYVKLQSTSSQGQFSGNILLSCPGMTGVTAKNISVNASVSTNPVATISLNGQSSICQGDSVILNANTGTGLIYQWKNNGTNITGATAANYTATTSGSYTVVVTNSNGCSATSTATSITVNPLPTATITAGGATSFCQGGSVVLNANTGTGLTYQWKNNGTNITGATTASYTATTSGSYTVVVTNSNGCSATSLATTVSVNSNASPTFSQVTPICFGESLSPLPTTSTNGVIGNWSPALDNTTSTTYTFVPLSGQCSSSNATMTIIVNSLPLVIAGSDESVCSGSLVTLTATGANSYVWTNGVQNNVPFTPASSNTYIVTGTDLNGCQSSDTVNVTVLQNSSSQLTQSALDSYTLNGQTYTQSGTYTQVIPNAAGCDSTITLNLTLSFTGLSEVENDHLSIYPNPTTDFINIVYDGEIHQVELVDMKGAILYVNYENKTEHQLPNAIQTGLYTFVIHTDNGIVRKKLMVK